MHVVQDEPPLNLKVLINFAPQNSRAATLQPIDTSALVSISTPMANDPITLKISLA